MQSRPGVALPLVRTHFGRGDSPRCPASRNAPGALGGLVWRNCAWSITLMVLLCRYLASALRARTPRPWRCRSICTAWSCALRQCASSMRGRCSGWPTRCMRIAGLLAYVAHDAPAVTCRSRQPNYRQIQDEVVGKDLPDNKAARSKAHSAFTSVCVSQFASGASACATGSKICC